MPANEKTEANKDGASSGLAVGAGFGEFVDIMPIYHRAMRERDAWNRWSVTVAMKLGVSCDGFNSADVGEQYAELRGRIDAALSSPNVDDEPHPEKSL